MNKRTNSVVLALVCLLFSIQGASAQMKWNSAYQSYIDQYKDLAIEQMLRYNIPASITLAQGLFESAAGRSNLTRSGNNHFGIKCHGWTGKRTYHDDDAAGECFRAYDNARQSYEDHSRFLATQSRYARLFSLKRTDYRGWARGLKQCGYATNPQYASKLTQIIELYGLNKYDRATTYDRFIAKHASEESPGPDGVRYVIKAYNDNYYVIAKKGETFKSLGKELGISGRKLAKYNERDKRETLDDGDVIYLKKKRNKAERNFKNRPHTVKAGESMYSIAQKYGIRLKSLYKKNRLSPDYNIRVGDKLRVY
ncbi:glucosaminidase domain-containing protein [uncultured Prevotella sp.]|uniref:glucosaminidase domain-containing protein n=1 Tax=uncultured Prevotella sp. TaxID=159272 RepID=UPI0035B260E3